MYKNMILNKSVPFRSPPSMTPSPGGMDRPAKKMTNINLGHFCISRVILVSITVVPVVCRRRAIKRRQRSGGGGKWGDILRLCSDGGLVNHA